MRHAGTTMIVAAMLAAAAPAPASAQELFAATIGLKCSAENDDQTKFVQISIATRDVVVDCVGSDPAAIAAHTLAFDPDVEEILVVDRCTMMTTCLVGAFSGDDEVLTVKETGSDSTLTTTTTTKGFRLMSFTFGGVPSNPFGTALFTSTDVVKGAPVSTSRKFKLVAKIQGAHDGAICEGKFTAGKQLQNCPPG